MSSLILHHKSVTFWERPEAGDDCIVAALQSGQFELLSPLLDRGAGSGESIHGGLLAFLSALPDTRFIRMLVSHTRFDPFKELSKGTSLHFMATENHPLVAKFLVSAGADPLQPRSSDGLSALAIAISNNHVQVLCALLEAPNVDLNSPIAPGGISHLRLAESANQEVSDTIASELANHLSVKQTGARLPVPYYPSARR